MNTLITLIPLLAPACCAIPPSFAGPRDADGYQNIAREPDSVRVTTETGDTDLSLSGGAWRGVGVEVKTTKRGQGLRVELSAPDVAVKYVTVRWNGTAPRDWEYLGDAWERGYGDLQWLPLDAGRTIPWYFLASDGATTHGYGVMTQPAAMCAWNVDKDGVTLKADVRCGGAGVTLGDRRLAVCTVVTRRGKTGETPFAATQAFCRQMCPKPRLPKQPIYGFNDWYCDYGNNSAASVLEYAKFVARLSPKGTNRPFMVIDDGWQPKGGAGSGGPWDRSNAKFPSMTQLAADIRRVGARPGIWVRLLTAQEGQPDDWRIKGKDDVLDISKPEVRAYVKETIARLHDWGYDLIKHDYSTRDISDSWGGSAGAAPDATWAFSDRSRTTAEILLDHYRSIREGAGSNVIIGCNTVGHLAAGVFEAQRIGDDTSGREWARTLKMGVNSLAFRAAQHGTFYAADADCVGLTQAGAIPWERNQQWMDLIAKSGTPLFISFKKGSVTPEQEQAIAEALAIAAKPHETGEPLDWFDALQPRHWKLMGIEVDFDWGG